MRGIATLLLCVSATALQAQIEFAGRIVDAKTEQSLPYVNIGIVAKGLGTVSNEEGFFYLSIDTLLTQETDIIQISSLGYETIEIAIKEVSAMGNKKSMISMLPAEIELQEVVVKSSALVPVSEFVGHRNQGERNYGYWNKNTALGGELATKIRVRRGQRQLKSLEFEVLENPSDSLLIRVNIYDNDGKFGRPDTNLNSSKKSIIHTIKKGRSISTVDLFPYDIFVFDSFFVSIELLQVYGDSDLGLVLAASSAAGSSYRKYASQDDWEFISDIHMAYYLETSSYVSQRKALKYEAKVERSRLKKRQLSGYVIFSGKMLENVTVTNSRTKETVNTDEMGRYIITAEKDDIIFFSKEGYSKMLVKVNDQQFANAILKLDDSVDN